MTPGRPIPFSAPRARRCLRGNLVALLLGLAAPAFAAHAYAQFGDIKYPAGFDHFQWAEPAAPKGGTLTLVPPTRITEFDKYNPFTLKGTAPPGLGELLLESLLTGSFDEPTTAYGLLAEDVAVAPDHLSVTFRLNPAARFHDGQPVLALDVKASFDALTGKLSHPAYRAMFADVKDATVLSERTVEFHFRRASAELPLIVGGMPVFSHRWGGGKPFELLSQRAADESLARLANIFEPLAPLLATQRFQLRNRSRSVEVFAKHGDVDVLGKPLDQTVSFRQRRAALEQQARAAGFKAAEQRIERPAYPEVFLDILHGRTQPHCGREKEFAAIVG